MRARYLGPRVVLCENGWRHAGRDTDIETHDPALLEC